MPNNILQIDACAEHFDGFSIGTNDLTQLVLGVVLKTTRRILEVEARLGRPPSESV